MRHNFFFKIKPVVAVIAIIALLVPLSVMPKKASADFDFIVGGHLDFLAAIGFVPQLAVANTQTFFEWAQTFVLETVKKRLLDTIVDQILAWIQGGDTPKFITDWGQFLQDAGNVAVGDFARGIDATNLCSPFSAQIKAVFGNGSSQSFASPIACTLDQIVSNVDSFYQDFSNGGWLAYEESLKPQNNIFSVYVMTKTAQYEVASAAQNAAALKGLANGGYKDQQECLEPFQTTPDPKLGPDLDDDKKYGDYDCRTTTPGGIFKNLAEQATWVGTGIPAILSAKQLNEYLGSIADSLLSRLISEGIGGLRNLTTPHASDGSGGGANRCSAYSGKQFSACTTACKNTSGALLQACVGYAADSQNNLVFAVSGLIDEINRTLVPRQAAQAKLQSALIVEQNLITFLNSKKTNASFSFCAAIVQPDIDTASSTSATLATEIASNQVIIDPLASAVASLSSLSVNDWGNYTTLASQLPSNLGPEAAQSFLTLANLQVDGNGDPTCGNFSNRDLTCEGVTQFNNAARNRASVCH